MTCWCSRHSKRKHRTHDLKVLSLFLGAFGVSGQIDGTGLISLGEKNLTSYMMAALALVDSIGGVCFGL